jgi:hypothetical protein
MNESTPSVSLARRCMPLPLALALAEQALGAGSLEQRAAERLRAGTRNALALAQALEGTRVARARDSRPAVAP